MTKASCPELADANCPCFRAVLNNCTYCTLLQGKKTCNCSWDGNCAYNYVPWQEIFIPECSDNTLLSATQYQNAWSLIIKADKTLLSALPGSIISFEDPIAAHSPQSILLSSYPESGLAYLVSFDTYPFTALQNQTIQFTVRDNAFLGYEHLQTLYNKQLLLLTAEKLMDIISPFILSLKKQSDVMVGDISKPLSLKKFNPDVIFLAGSKDNIQAMLPQIPPSFNSEYILWIT